MPRHPRQGGIAAPYRQGRRVGAGLTVRPCSGLRRPRSGGQKIGLLTIPITCTATAGYEFAITQDAVFLEIRDNRRTPAPSAKPTPTPSAKPTPTLTPSPKPTPTPPPPTTPPPHPPTPHAPPP